MTQHEAAPRWAPAGEPFLEQLGAVIREASARSPLDRVTVVTPSFQSAFFLRRRLLADPSLARGLFNVNFERLDDLADRLAGAGDGRRPLSRLKASELVHMAATDPSLALPPALERVRDHPAFHGALHSTFEDLRAAPGGALSPLNAEVDPVSGGVAAIWRSYLRRAEGFDDRLVIALRAAAAVTDGLAEAAALGQLVVLVVEEPAAQYRPFLASLMGFPGTVTLVAATGDEIADRVVRLGPGADRRASVRAATGTRLVSVPDPSEEALWIVRDILGFARDGGRLGRVAVLYADPLDGRRLVEAFRASDIPVSGPDPMTMAQGPEGRWLGGILAVCTSGLGRDDVAAWITGAPVANPDDDGRPVNGSRWDAISRAAGVVSGTEQWQQRVRARAERLRASVRHGSEAGELSDPEAEGWLAEVSEAEALAQFMGGLARVSQPPPDGSPWSAFADWLRDLHDRYYHRPPAAPAGPDDKPVDAVTALVERLDELDELGGRGPELSRFIAVVQEALDRPMGPPRERARGGFEPLGRGVFVAPLRLAVGCDFDRVYVTGMAEGRYPARPAEDPLLPDVARQRLDPDGDWLPRRADRRASARRRYMTALSTAPERVLVWPRMDPGSRRALAPALWFMESARALSEADGGEPLRLAADLRAERDRPWLTVVGADDAHESADEAGDRHERGLRSLAAWTSSGRAVSSHYLALEDSGQLARACALEAARYGPAWTAFDGNLVDSLPGDDALEQHPMSPTRLQTWAACPFRYFLAYTLRIAAIEAPEEALTISPADMGSLVHRVLERFAQVRHDGEVSGPLSRDEQEVLLLSEAEATFREFSAWGVKGHPALWAAEAVSLRRRLRRFLEREAGLPGHTGMTQAAWEMAFGFEDPEVPAVEVAAAGGTTLRFRGFIDRVDLSEDGTRAIVSDYKTGSPSSYRAIERDPVAGGKLLQLPVYAAAVRARWPHVTEIEARYWFVFESGVNELISAPMSDMTEAFAPVVAGITEGIRAGVFPARPGESRYNGFENCWTCEFDRACPVRRGRLWERKREDRRLARYVEMAEGGGE